MAMMLGYHSDPKIKRKYIKRIEDHRKADELVQGVGWESNGVTRGCAVGCCFNRYDHSRGPVEIGVPVQLIYLEDYIFEGLPRADALKWPKQFLQAIEPGSDLSLVWPRFTVWLLIDKTHGVIRFAGEYKHVREVIERVAGLWQRVIDGESIESLRSEFAAARWAAADADARWAAAAAAARWAAADADARWAAAAAAAAADDARWADADARWADADARWADADARWAAADARWAAADARKVHWRACADKLLALIRECPVATGL